MRSGGAASAVAFEGSFVAAIAHPEGTGWVAAAAFVVAFGEAKAGGSLASGLKGNPFAALPDRLRLGLAGPRILHFSYVAAILSAA